MPHLFDLSEVKASLDAFLESEKHKTELPGFEGVVARAQQAILAPITIWRAEESNRGTDDNTIMNAIVGMCASTIVGEIKENCPPGDVDAQFEVANRIIAAVAEEIAITIIESIEAGHA